MDEKVIEEIINNPNKVVELINILNDSFENIYFGLTMKNLLELGIDNINYELITRDAISYYKTGECDTYATILCEIFGPYATKYSSEDHVVTKIGNHFYDVRGLRDNYVGNDFQKESPYYIDVHFGKRDNLSKPIAEQLIMIGKNVLDRYKEHTKKKIYDRF